MKPQPFYGAAELPAIIDTADDGTPLVDYRGWECWNCDTLWATLEQAEACCAEPEPVAPDHVVE